MKIPDTILQLTALDLFILFLLAGVMSESGFDSLPLITTIMNSIGQLILRGWPVLIGHSLYHHFPMLSRKMYRSFSICSVLLLSGVVLLPILVTFTQSSYTDTLVLPFVIVIWLAALFSLYFTAKMLETVKAGKITDSWDSIIFFFLLLFPPLGVWFVQPVIRKAMENGVPDTPTPGHEY